ncbi:MAG: S8 family serine peptidase [Phycisphaerales bacterium]|nr:S8 family serine peptidase [Phycisphaerales bacterium]
MIKLLTQFALLAIWGLGLAAYATAGTTTLSDQADVRLEQGEVIEDIHTTYGTLTLDVLTGTSQPHYLLQLPPGLSVADFLIQADADARIKSADVVYEVGSPMPSTQSLFFPRASLEYWNQPARFILDLNREPVAPPGRAPGPVPSIVVAIVDTGIDTDHPLLISSLATGISVFPDDPSVEDAPNGIDEDGDGLFDEVAGHGTFVAGLVHYVAPNAVLMPIRAMTSDGTSTSFLVAKGITAAVLNGAHVINVSLGTAGDANVIADAIETAEGMGVLVVAAAGNDSAAAAQFPAQSSIELSTIGVAGTQDNDVLAPFSNYGAGVSICAPSEMLVSSFFGGEYRSASGTSFSTALVTGAAARMLSASPALSPAQVRTLLASTAVSIDAANPGHAGELGAGRLDAGAALAQAGATLPLLAGDFNGDGTSNLDDLNIFLSVFGQTTFVGDINGDGAPNIDDLQLLLFGFGGQ